MGVNDWSRDPEANAVADPTIVANDGASARQFPRSLRGAMASVRKLADDQSGAITSTGGPNAYVVRTFSGLTDLRAGLSLSFVAHRGNSGPPSLSVDGHGALQLLNRDGIDLPAGYLKAGRLVRVIYVASPPSWRMIDLGVVANEDLVQAPARTIKGNAGDGLDDIPVADARVLLAVDKLPNKTEAELVASGAIADALATKASPELVGQLLPSIAFLPDIGTQPVGLGSLAAEIVSLRRWMGPAANGADITAALTAAIAAVPIYGGEIIIPAGIWRCGPIECNKAGVVIRACQQSCVIDARDENQPYIFNFTGTGIRALRDLTLRGKNNLTLACRVGCVVNGPRVHFEKIRMLQVKGGYDIISSNGPKILHGSIEGHTEFGIRWGMNITNADYKVAEAMVLDMDIYTQVSDPAQFTANGMEFGPRMGAAYIEQIRMGGHVYGYLFDATSEVGGQNGHLNFTKAISGIAGVAGWYFKSVSATVIAMVDCSASAGQGIGVKIQSLDFSLRWIGGSIHKSAVGVELDGGNPTARIRFIGTAIQSNTGFSSNPDSVLQNGCAIHLRSGAANVDLEGCYLGDQADFAISPGSPRQSYALVKRAPFTGQVSRMGGDWSQNGLGETLIGGTHPFISRFLNPADYEMGANGIPKLKLGGEEFNWTPVLSCAVPGDLSVAVTSVSGFINKQGKRVHAEFAMTVTPTYTTASGTSGAIEIQGLLDTSNGRSTLGGGQITAISAITWPTINTRVATQIQPAVPLSSTKINIQALVTNGTVAPVPITALPIGQPFTIRGYVDYLTV
ncbi:hypothetical protein [Methylobacterium sp. WCS2018Hpa-22]|uniref:hypothetical protein n=1 Tax=Methylobacterium sp. WCS2018Hpa-22 TaxID=3073633 RepID=UPI00288B12A4|nr:hypothetical protein [Methylobacterium sp. WCS2018Hpa-22]